MKKYLPNQQGSLVIILSIVIVLIILSGSAIYYFSIFQKSEESAKIQPEPSSTIMPTPTQSITSNIPTDWKTYSNNKYGAVYNFSFQYPPTWELREHDSGTSIDVAIFSPDYQADPNARVVESILQGARIEAFVFGNIITKNQNRFSSVEDYFKASYYNPSSGTYMYNPKETKVRINNDFMEGISYLHKGDVSTYAVLFLYNGSVYEFHIVSNTPEDYVSLLNQILSSLKFNTN
jgi:hypothetical protein